MIQFFVVYGINGEKTEKTYNTGIDVELGKTAIDSSLKILLEIAKKHNTTTVFKIEWTDIAVHSLTKLN